jgi:hypothetical protein
MNARERRRIYSSKFLYRKLGWVVMGILMLGGLDLARSVAQMPQLKRPEEAPAEKPAEAPPKKLVNEPRAVGLLQLNKSGKGTLIPIAIRIDGKFYDASAYKANPVPMALDGGTVYEVEKTGQSQGLFTVSGALHNQNPNSATPWLGAGQYVLNGTVAASKIHRAEDKPRGIEGADSGPPRLTRGTEGTPGNQSAAEGSGGTGGSSQKASTASSPAESQTGSGASAGAGSSSGTGSSSGAGSSANDDDSGRPQLKRAGNSASGADQRSTSQTGGQETNSEASAPKAVGSSGQSGSPPNAGSAGAQGHGGQGQSSQNQAGQNQAGQGQASQVQANQSQVNQSQSGQNQSGQNQAGQNYYRPVLRRGKPTQSTPEDTPEELTRTTETASPAQAAGSGDNAGAVKPAVQLVPAISDAGGPLPESFQFFWKESEEADRQKQMLGLAGDAVQTYLGKLAKDTIPAKPVETKNTASKRGTSAHKAAEKIEPEFENVEFHTFDVWRNDQPVMVLTAEAHLPQKTGASGTPMTYYVTLAARTDIYGDIRKLYSGVTDKFHLDVTPKLELIDAVDADGDGKGELLFRETTDAGNGYLIYRPTGDTLWKMFDSLNQE